MLLCFLVTLRSLKGKFYFLGDWLLHTSIFAAACALSLCLATEKMISGHLPPLATPLHALVAGATLLEYNVHALLNHHLTTDVKADRRWHWLCSFAGAALCFSIFYLSSRVILAVGFLGILSLAYSTPLLPFRYKRRIKDFGLAKIMILTSVWALVTTLLPLLAAGHDLDNQMIAELSLRFMLIFPLCVVFDMRDAQTDLAHDIYTLPNTLGLKASKWLTYLMIFTFTGIGIFWSFTAITRHPWWVFATVGVAALLACRFTMHRNKSYAYLFWVDGMMLFYAILSIAA